MFIHNIHIRDIPYLSLRIICLLQASGAWLLYKSNAADETFLFATLKGFSVIDEREGVKDEFRLAIGKSGILGQLNFVNGVDHDTQPSVDSKEGLKKEGYHFEPVPSMLIFDATLAKTLTSVSLYIQRPKLLVALDFLLAIAEFFVPSVRNMLSNEEDVDPLNMRRAIILDHPIYHQPRHVSSLSPRTPLVVDDDRFDHFIYDGKGGKLYLHDRSGNVLSYPSPETIIYVGCGKRLQFKNVTIMVLLSSIHHSSF